MRLGPGPVGMLGGIEVDFLPGVFLTFTLFSPFYGVGYLTHLLGRGHYYSRADDIYFWGVIIMLVYLLSALLLYEFLVNKFDSWVGRIPDRSRE